MRKLSVVVPVYNERATVLEVLTRVRSVAIPADLEIVVVDDGSSDGTTDLLRSLRTGPELVVDFASTNRGKGSAVRRGIALTTGDYILVQDADLELDPSDYGALLAAASRGPGDAVYGSRFLGRRPNWWSHHYWANRALTALTNLLFGTALTDMGTGFKLFPAGLLKTVRLESSGFDFDAEVTAKMLRMGVRLAEVPVGYRPRTVTEGKKVRWPDALHAINTLLRVRFADERTLRTPALVEVVPSAPSDVGTRHS